MGNDVTLVRCPKCQCQTWQDIPNVTESMRTRFYCSRCRYTITIGNCSKCKTKNWLMVSGIDEKGPHRPVYRLKCQTCGRMIGVIIDSFDE